MKSLLRILLSSIVGATSTVIAVALVSVLGIIAVQGDYRTNPLDDSPERGAISLMLFGGPALGALAFLGMMICGFMATRLQWRQTSVIRYSLALAVVPSTALTLLFAPLANAMSAIGVGIATYFVLFAGIFPWWSVLRGALTSRRSKAPHAL